MKGGSVCDHDDTNRFTKAVSCNTGPWETFENDSPISIILESPKLMWVYGVYVFVMVILLIIALIGYLMPDLGIPDEVQYAGIGMFGVWLLGWIGSVVYISI